MFKKITEKCEWFKRWLERNYNLYAWVKGNRRQMACVDFKQRKREKQHELQMQLDFLREGKDCTKINALRLKIVPN